jgi:hypothetical protein
VKLSGTEAIEVGGVGLGRHERQEETGSDLKGGQILGRRRTIQNPADPIVHGNRGYVNMFMTDEHG